MIYLRQSTASQEVPLGYFVDSSDGNTEKTGLTISNTDIKVWKTGATTLASKNSGGATHIANGIYYAVLDATDTDTVGPLVLFCHVSGALSIRLECCVLASALYDWMFGTAAPNTTAPLDAAGTRTALGLASANLDTQLDALPTNAELATALAGADDATLSAIAALNNLSAAQVNAEVDAALADYDGPTHAELTAELAAADDVVLTQVALVKAKTDNLPSDPADHSLIIAATDALATLIGDVPTNAELATALAGADDAVLTQVALVKEKTDQLVFTKTNELDVNIQSVNGVTVNGDGAGTPWGP